MQKQDILNRSKFVGDLIEIVETISARDGARMFAIDGEWGSGKSYVLEMFEEKIASLQSEEEAGDRYFLFHYNCWEYDYYEEPIIAIVAAMLDTVNEKENLFSGKVESFIEGAMKTAGEAVKEIAGEVIKNKIGFDVVGTLEKIKEKGEGIAEENKKFDNLSTFKETLKTVREQLKKIAEYKPIIWVVDELDRCLPDYAIKVLERLHHLLKGIPNITVIIAIDQKQLENSVKQIFGEKTEASQYLKKFIDFTLKLDKGKMTKGFYEKYSSYFELFREFPDGEGEFQNMFYVLFDGYDIRRQEKIMENVELIHRIVCETDEKRDASLMWLEVLWFGLRLRTGSSDFSWILQLNITGNELGMLGLKLGNFMKKMITRIEGRNTTFLNARRRTVLLHENVEDRMFWLWDKVLKENIFVWDEECDLRTEEECAVRFVKLAEVLLS